MVSVDRLDARQFWTAELDKVIKKIRHDFEQLYGNLHREMVTYYDTQWEGIQAEVEQVARYQLTETRMDMSNYQTLQIEYEKVQQTYAYEREALEKLEVTVCK